MKNSIKYRMVVALVLVGATLLISGNAGAVIVAPQPSAIIVGAAPMANPVFGSGVAPGLGIAPRPAFAPPFFNPFFRPFFPFFNPFFNPFVDVDPFIGLGVNPGVVD